LIPLVGRVALVAARPFTPQITIFIYTEPDGWQPFRFDGTAEQMIARMLNEAQAMIQRRYGTQACRRVLSSRAHRDLGTSEAAALLAAGKSVRCQIFIGEAHGPVADAQEEQAHKAYMDEGQKSLDAINKATGLNYQRPQ